VRNPISQELSRVQTISEVLLSRGITPRVKVISLGIVRPPEVVSRALLLNGNEKLLLAKRLLCVPKIGFMDTAMDQGRQMQLMQGNRAIAEGAIYASARFYAGYPITPSSEIADECAVRMPKVGGCRPARSSPRRAIAVTAPH
jgi:DNA-binding GntR family transcriptional regulator